MLNSLTELVSGAAYNTNNQTERLSSLLTAASSGTRITRALDDIASLSAATALSSEVSGLRAASLNVAQANSFLGVADGAIGQIGGILDRLSQLATQSNSGALDDTSREALNSEFQQLLAQLERLAGDTNFNGVPLLDGSLSRDSGLNFDAQLEAGDVSASGTIGDSLVTGATGEVASVQLVFEEASDIAVGNTISIGDGAGGSVNFQFVTGSATTANEIQIGATIEESLENAAAAINAFQGNNDAGVAQLNARLEGDNRLLLEGQTTGNLFGADGTTAITVSQTTGGTLSNSAFDNGAVGGIDVRDVSAQGFNGQISGFDATLAGNNRVNLSIDVGGETFRSSGVNTDVAVDEVVTFNSENGGSFNVTLAGGQGETVNSQIDADGFAARLDAAFNGVNFSQNRDVTSFIASGELVGASVALDASNFDNIRVGSAALLNGRLEVEIAGQRFRSSALGSSVGAGERITLAAENGDSLNFVNGQNRFDISNAAGAQQFANAFENALGNGESDRSAPFQISSGSDGRLQLGIGNFTQEGLGLENLNLLSSESSGEAFAAVGTAIQTLTSQRSDVGAFQQALDFAANNIESAIQNQEAARSVLLDTDIAANPTELSLLEAAQEASVNTTAQTNRLQSNLLKLIE